MPAEVETMMYAREVPWHGFGTKVDGLQTAKEAIVAAGLDWKVLLRPLYIRELNHGKKGRVVKVPGNFATVRDIDSTPLGVVGNTYRPVQNIEAFEMADAIVETGEAKYETAGALRSGRIVFLSMEIPKQIIVAGDDGVIQPYLLLANSHDGSSALRALITTVRVVCANTLNMALNSAKAEIKLRHTTNVLSRVEEAQRALGITFKYLEQLQITANSMMLRSLTESDVRFALLTLFPIKDVHPAGMTLNEMVTAFGENDTSPAAKALQMYQSSSNLDNIRGTSWGLFNGVAEYLDYGQFYRARDGSSALDSRARSILLNGAAAKTKERAASLLTQIGSLN